MVFGGFGVVGWENEGLSPGGPWAIRQGEGAGGSGSGGGVGWVWDW